MAPRVGERDPVLQISTVIVTRDLMLRPDIEFVRHDYRVQKYLHQFFNEHTFSPNVHVAM